MIYATSVISADTAQIYATSVISAEPAHPSGRSDQSLHCHKHDVFVLKLFANREEIL